jgi:flap endonuclease-1
MVTGDAENIEKFNRRLVKVTKQHNEECKELLKLMGIPYVDVSYVLAIHFILGKHVYPISKWQISLKLFTAK